jgi:hypothetical protein
MVFEQFFLSMQQDIKIFIFFPLLCALLRTVFIKVNCPYPNLKGRGKVLLHCYRYGFWWGMDFNAYIFLISLLFVTLPGLVFPMYHTAGDMVRFGIALIYATVLYGAFAGKMIFYYHFHDIYDQTLRLGAHAEKRNLIDIFFHQDHGGWILLGLIPYWVVCGMLVKTFLGFPSLAYPHFESAVVSYAFNGFIGLASILGFYFIRYGGTFMHDNKPDWDSMPSSIKSDIFFARAAVDDLPGLKRAFKQQPNEVYTHTDEQDLAAIRRVIPNPKQDIMAYPNPAYAFHRVAEGAKIKKPSHIFLLVGESYLRQLFEPTFACLNLVSGGRKLLEDPHTATLENFLSAGVISRPSIVSLMSGIFDSRLELNEKEAFWNGTVPTAFPLQLKKLGYTSTYWYGGSATHGNFNQLAPACGFDRVMSAPDFCGADAPKTWVGVYDTVFLKKTAELIQQMDSGKPEFHFVYTTSYHGPFKINLKKYGYDPEKVMPDAPEDIRKNHSLQKDLGTFWLSDQAIGTFIQTMREVYPDCLFIVTADHAINMSPLKKTSLMKRDCNIHERRTPMFMMNHQDIDQTILAGNTMGSHMHIMPTVLELIAPKGFEYYSLFPSLTHPIDHVISPYNWLRPGAIGYYGKNYYQPLGREYGPTDTREGTPPFLDEIEGYKDLTGYMVRHPELLQPLDEILKNKN